MIHMKVKPFLHVNHNVWFLFIVVFLNESRETAWEMYLPLLCHWGWKRRHEWTQDLYFCANNSKKWGPELVKRGPERTQDLYSGRYNEKGRSWVSEKRSWADSGPLFWTLQWKREVLSLWTEPGVSKSRYFGISIPIKYSNFSRFYKKKWVHFIKNSDVISLVIDQSQPGVFYLQKMMNFMKPGVFYL